MSFPNHPAMGLSSDSDLLMPDTLMPVQFHLRNTESPLKKLFLAVLEDALRVLGSGTNKRLIFEAREWIAEDNRHIFGFTNTCEVLGIPPEQLRARILSGVPLQVKRRAPVIETPLTIS